MAHGETKDGKTIPKVTLVMMPIGDHLHKAVPGMILMKSGHNRLPINLERRSNLQLSTSLWEATF